jgi:hypothetical protein
VPGGQDVEMEPFITAFALVQRGAVRLLALGAAAVLASGARGGSAGQDGSVRAHNRQAGAYNDNGRCSAKACRDAAGSMRLTRRCTARKAGGSCALQKAAPSGGQVACGAGACDR